jgi:replicative DNA helicase
MHNPEMAAAKVLGKAMLDRQARLLAFRELDPPDFPAEWRGLFEAMRRLDLEGVDCDPKVIGDRWPDLTAAALQASVEEVSGDGQAYWVTRLKEVAEEHRAVQALEAMRRELDGAGVWSERRGQMERLWTDAVTGPRLKSGGMVALRHVVEEVLQNILPHHSGVPDWDAWTGGFTPGTVHILAGRPGMGKTTLSLQWARSVAAQGVGVLCVPLEMGQVRLKELGRIQGELPVTLYTLQDPPRRWEPLSLEARWGMEASEGKLLLIDHLGYVRMAPKRDRNRVEEVGEILRSLRTLLRAMKASALVVCQLNREVEKRRSARPSLSDLRESGEIENEADSVTFLWHSEAERHKAKADCVLTVAKNRYGPTGEIGIVLERSMRRFVLPEAARLPYADAEVPF